MKVYTKIVYDKDDNIIEEHSYNYKGPVSQAKKFYKSSNVKSDNITKSEFKTRFSGDKGIKQHEVPRGWSTMKGPVLSGPNHRPFKY